MTASWKGGQKNEEKTIFLGRERRASLKEKDGLLLEEKEDFLEKRNNLYY